MASMNAVVGMHFNYYQYDAYCAMVLLPFCAFWTTFMSGQA